MSTIHYKSVSTLLDMLTILDEQSRAPYNICPRSIGIRIVMTINFGNGNEKDKFGVSKLYGCKFPASLCCTQTETNGNAPCFTNYFCISVCFYDKSHMYVQNECDKRIIIIIIIIIIIVIMKQY